jgi:hypothetical protein
MVEEIQGHSFLGCLGSKHIWPVEVRACHVLFLYECRHRVSRNEDDVSECFDNATYDFSRSNEKGGQIFHSRTLSRVSYFGQK